MAKIKIEEGKGSAMSALRRLKPSVIVFSLLSCLFAGAAGIVVGFFAARVSNHSEDSSKQVRQSGNYQYINPLLECEIAEGSIDVRKENFHADLEKFIEALKEENKLTEMSVYFRDLNNGPAFGINTEGKFFPASLLKVPVMMVYYHLAEERPDLLKEQIFFDAPVDLGVNQGIIPRISLEAGTSYTIEQLIERMIVYSDNQALRLLSEKIPTEELQNLFTMIGADTSVIRDAHAKLTVKEYAGFFRILFNSSYLSRNFSEHALKVLSFTDYHDALPAGVPQDMKVSHKFGEAGTNWNEHQLHDCGIVYVPQHPYLICIMTRGRDIGNLKDSIRETSRFVYQKVDEQY